MALNRSLKQARELRGWSQAKVAREIGTDATTVSRWERGLFSPTPYFRERLCAVFEKNTAELGLLETADQPQERAWNDAPLLLHAAAASLLQSGGEQQEGRLCSENLLVLVPPCWTESTDIFTYILRSAAHDLQAHMLWKDAYVRALLGESAEARRLGEASLRAFECLGHVNAQAVREWLNQEISGSIPPRSAVVPVVSSSGPSRQRKIKAFVREQGAKIALLLIGSFWFLFSLDFTLVK
ncbi:MAG TPA: helix-turn-helix transcriptional regulator [Ktedonobacteraceae bacterium]